MRGFRGAVGLIACIVVVVCAAGLRAGSRQVDPYKTIVSAYRDQDAGAVRRLAALAEGQIRAAVDEVLSGAKGNAPWSVDDVRAAALLHTELCLRLLKEDQQSTALVHLNAAHALVDLAARNSRVPITLTQGWYETVIAAIRDRAPAWSEDLRKSMRNRYGASPGLADFYDGLVLEQRACEREPLSGFLMKRSVDLRGATWSYEQALRKAPGLHVAALHLGRARILQGAPNEAVPLLEAASSSTVRSERHLALLFLGAIAEEKNQLDVAESRYRLALEAFPWGQSGPMALSRVLARAGREAEARAIVTRYFARASGRVIDPLWTYLNAPGEEPAAAFMLLRAEVWR